MNANIATTCHKLQGMTKKNVVITEWGRHKNWVYVVLSRETTRLGLFLLKKFNIRDLEGLEVPRSLKSFETRMRKVEKAFIAGIQLLKHKH